MWQYIKTNCPFIPACQPYCSTPLSFVLTSALLVKRLTDVHPQCLLHKVDTNVSQNYDSLGFVSPAFLKIYFSWCTEKYLSGDKRKNNENTCVNVFSLFFQPHNMLTKYYVSLTFFCTVYWITFPTSYAISSKNTSILWNLHSAERGGGSF